MICRNLRCVFHQGDWYRVLGRKRCTAMFIFISFRSASTNPLPSWFKKAECGFGIQPAGSRCTVCVCVCACTSESAYTKLLNSPPWYEVGCDSFAVTSDYVHLSKQQCQHQNAESLFHILQFLPCVLHQSHIAQCKFANLRVSVYPQVTFNPNYMSTVGTECFQGLLKQPGTVAFDQRCFSKHGRWIEENYLQRRVNRHLAL